MNYEDEDYVKVFTRDTLTWKSWSWETQALLLFLLRKVDKAGFIETGGMGTAAALVIQLGLPSHVVTLGLQELVASGTAMIVDKSVFLPKFLAAQESRKSEARKKRDYRERVIARRLVASDTQTNEITIPHVPSVAPLRTARHQVAPTGTATDPPALLCSALLCSLNSLRDQENLLPQESKPKKPKKEKRTPDPRHAPLVKTLMDVYADEHGGAMYAFRPSDARHVTELLSMSKDDKLISYKWLSLLQKSKDKYFSPKTRSLSDLVRNWNSCPVLVSAPKPESEVVMCIICRRQSEEPDLKLPTGSPLCCNHYDLYVEFEIKWLDKIPMKLGRHEFSDIIDAQLAFLAIHQPEVKTDATSN